MFDTAYYSQDTHPPLRYFKGHPVYLSTLIAAAHALAALLTVFAGSSFSDQLIYAPLWHDAFREPWRLVTWAFAERVSVWLLVGTCFLYFLGKRYEMRFGTRFFGLLYLVLILASSVAAFILSHLFPRMDAVLAGACIYVTFTLFAGTCLLEPNAPFWGIEKFPMKWVGAISVGLGILGYTADRDWGALCIMLSMLVVIYVILRRTGMPPRFVHVSQAFKDSLPSRKPSGNSPARPERAKATVKSGTTPSKYYEPKIKPKPDIAPERKAVEEVDAILDKIARSGMDSLSDAEKAALQKASSKLKDTDY